MPAENVERFEARTIDFTGGEFSNRVFAYRLLEPATTAQGATYPLVLYLHGRGERGIDNSAQLRFLPEWMAGDAYRARYPCFLIAPQCLPDRYWVETRRGADPEAPRVAAGPQMQIVINILEAILGEFPIDRRRLYLTGLSMGGFGAWDLGTRLGERWAAVAPICGGGDEMYAHRLVGVPVWAWHGDADDVVPVDRSRRMIAAIRRAGGEPKYTELAGVGHDSWTPAYSDPAGLVSWMFAQQTP
jgi:predicted peptidase